MIKEVRDKFNAEFSETRYHNFLNDVWQLTNGAVDFRICETPLFIDSDLKQSLITASEDILNQLAKPEFRTFSENAVPEKLIVKNEDDHPLFVQIDFGIVESNGKLVPQLIELQGFPSLYSFQVFLDRKIREHFNIEPEFGTYYNGYDFESYVNKFRKTLLADEDPENVILLEIDPDKQKTRIDFYLTELYTGVSPVCISKIFEEKGKLFYIKNSLNIPVKRIYNRVIFDELIKKNIPLNFDIHGDLDVDWVGHPNWFFKLSKHTLPYLKSVFVPHSFSLSNNVWKSLNLDEYVLKPLYSFAGSGVMIDIDKNSLENIQDKQNYILQKKVDYAPVLETPDGRAKVEIRMMFLWYEKPVLINNLLRISKGKMMGVDFNKNKNWIGASTVYHIK